MVKRFSSGALEAALEDGQREHGQHEDAGQDSQQRAGFATDRSVAEVGRQGQRDRSGATCRDVVFPTQGGSQHQGSADQEDGNYDQIHCHARILPKFAAWVSEGPVTDSPAQRILMAAVPLLIRLAPSQLAARRYDAVCCWPRASSKPDWRDVPRRSRLITATSISAAIAHGLSVAESALPHAWDKDAELALRGSIAVFRGDLGGAQAIFESDDE